MNHLSDRHCYIPDWIKKGVAKLIKIKVLNEKKCSTHMHKTKFTIFPNLRDVICVKDIKKRFDIIRKKTYSTQTVSERNLKVDPTND